jgi:hypothetical protein
MIVALETVRATGLNLCLNSKGWRKGLALKRDVVAEDEVCVVSTLINNINKFVEIMLEASNTVDIAASVV